MNRNYINEHPFAKLAHLQDRHARGVNADAEKYVKTLPASTGGSKEFITKLNGHNNV